ncbi:hypothetical protein Tco_0352534 [Tanacetum coccineum]
MVPATTSLTGFSRETIWPLGQLRLLVTIGDAEHFTKSWMNFMIVRSLSLYNGIIGRPRIREIQEVPSTAHGMLKFPVNEGIVTIRSTILIPAECVTVTTSSTRLTTSSKEILKRAEVRLIKLEEEGQAMEHAKAIQAEVQKLVEAGIMREIYYHAWLSNPVMVKKHDVTPLSVSTPAIEYIAIPKCPSASRTPAPHTSGWFTKLLTAKGGGRNVLRVEDYPGRDKTVPRQNKSHATNLVPTDNQRGPEPQWKVG